MNLETTPPPPHHSRRRVRWWRESLVVILVAVALCAISLGGCIAFELNRQLFPRFGLKSFDPAKAAQLTPEKRAAYEQELFSELQRWDKESRRYPERGEFVLREQRWQDMADDGFELAHITLRVLSPTELQTFALGGPVKRLEQLAENGDTGAMCLMTVLVSQAAAGQNIGRYDAARRKWLERGAELGHPECLTQLGRRLMAGSDGYPQDIKRGLSLEFAARQGGYAHDVWALISYYQEQEFDNTPPMNVERSFGFREDGKARLAYRNLANVRRLYCWSQMNDQYWVWNRSQWLLEDIQSESQRTHRPDLAALHDELQGKQYSLQDCVNLGTGEPTP